MTTFYRLADLGERGSLNLDDEGLRDVILNVVRRVWVEEDGQLTIEGVLGREADTVYPPSYSREAKITYVLRLD